MPAGAAQGGERPGSFRGLTPLGIGGIAGSVVGVAILAAVIASLWTRTRPAPRYDANVLAVVPFKLGAVNPSQHFLRDGMLDLLAIKLSDGGALRAVDPRAMLAAWRAATSADAADPELGAGYDAAARVGAGQLVIGEITSGTASGRIAISAALYDTRARQERVRAHAEGGLDSLTYLVDRLAAQLLMIGPPEGSQRLSAMTSSSAIALRAYLKGESSARRGRFVEASVEFSRALDADPTFALAALGLFTAGTKAARPQDAQRGARLAWRHRARLGERDFARLHAALGPSYPSGGTADERRAAVERYAAIAPDAPEAWYWMGGWYVTHGGDDPEAAERALDAFTRALTLDPSYAAELEHLPDLYAAAGDSAAARRTQERLATFSQAGRPRVGGDDSMPESNHR